MQKISIKLPKDKNKRKSTINSNNANNYLISFVLKFISAIILILVIIFQLELLLIFIINIIANNIYYIIILLIVTHIIFIKFIVQSILYVLRCPLVNSICFYTISCNQMQQLLISSKNIISLYKNFQKKSNKFNRKDFLFIDDIGKIMNGYFNFFRTIKKGAKLSPNQNALYEKLGALIEIFENYNNYLSSLNININIKEKEIKLNPDNNPKIIEFVKKMANESNEINKILNEFLCDNYEFFSFKSLYSCFINNDFFNIEQLSVLFHKRFNNKYRFFITSDNQVIDYTIISYEKLNRIYKKKKNLKSEEKPKELTKKNLILYCNPNGMIYQLFTPDKFISLLEGGCDILLWNYRGYGGSTGYPTFKNAKTDALELFDYAKKKYINYNRFGVYGYSVGGGSAIYLANKRNLDVLVCDRNFSSVSDIVKEISFFGNALYYLLKIIDFKYDSNAEEFAQSKNKNICKVILCDPNDEIIPNSASLKTGVSKYIIKKYCEEQKIKIRENILEIFLESKDNLNIKFMETLIYLISLLKKFDENPFQDLFPEINKTKNNKNKNNLNDFLLLNVGENFSFRKKSFKNLIIKTIIKIFNSFKFSPENLEDIKKKDERRLKILHINNYFNNFIVWGCISDEKLIEENGFANPFSIENNISYINNAINCINDFFNDETFIDYMNNDNYKEIFEHLNIIKKCLQIFMNKSKVFDLKYRINKGNLIRLNCGHNGNFSESDKQNLIDILKNVNFIQ